MGTAWQHRRGEMGGKGQLYTGLRERRRSTKNAEEREHEEGRDEERTISNPRQERKKN